MGPACFCYILLGWSTPAKKTTKRQLEVVEVVGARYRASEMTAGRRERTKKTEGRGGGPVVGVGHPGARRYAAEREREGEGE